MSKLKKAWLRVSKRNNAVYRLILSPSPVKAHLDDDEFYHIEIPYRDREGIDLFNFHFWVKKNQRGGSIEKELG